MDISNWTKLSISNWGPGKTRRQQTAPRRTTSEKTTPNDTIRTTRKDASRVNPHIGGRIPQIDNTTRKRRKSTTREGR